MEVVASLSQVRTAAAQCGLFTYKSVPVIFEPPCNILCYLAIQTVLWRLVDLNRKVANAILWLSTALSFSGRHV